MTHHADVDQADAVFMVVERARDARLPAPRMRACLADVPFEDDGGLMEGAADVVVGAAKAGEPYPLLARLMVKFGAGQPARVVRVDAWDSYRDLRGRGAADVLERLAVLEEAFAEHAADPSAHDSAARAALLEEADILGGDLEDVLGEEAAGRVDLWVPRRFRGILSAWREGDRVCASLVVPGVDGEVRVCTGVEPLRRCLAEVSRHAAESGASPSLVAGVLPAMGVCLGAGTVLKELAASAPAILALPEAAGRRPFLVRVEPAAAPALCAIAALLWECRRGNRGACAEWERLAAEAPAPVRRAMGEARRVLETARA